MEVRDSVIITGGPIDPESHCEPIASHPSPGGVTSNVHIARSRFIAEIRPTPCYTSYCAGYTGITNVTGTDYVFTDSVFGDPAQVHPAWYMIYEIGATFIRPRFYPGKAAVFYYGAPTGADLVSPTFL
jgi:hypothetical protein